MGFPPVRSLGALAVTLFLVLKGVVHSDESSLSACRWLSREAAEAALGDSVAPLALSGGEPDDQSCGYRSANPRSDARLEISLLEYPSDALADLAYQTQLRYSREDGQGWVWLEPGLGRAAFCAVAGDGRLAWMDLVDGSQRLVVKVAGVSEDPELLAATTRRLAKAAWESLDR
jgi:hypothetical protein